MLHANFRKVLMAGLCFAVIGLLLPNAIAQRFDRGTTMTVNQPFELPGIALPAGTYVIRLMDVAGSRNVVQILNADETKSYGIVLAIADYRLNATDKTEFSFYEAQPGAPPPLRAWFYPGFNYGVEFVYPKTKAVEIAQTSGEHVIATPEPAEESTAANLTTEPLIAIQPGGEEVAVATVHPEPLVTEAPVPVFTAKAELPRTASPFPFVALTGLLAAGAAGALRIIRKRTN
jgi:hypothetical protein